MKVFMEEINMLHENFLKYKTTLRAKITSLQTRIEAINQLSSFRGKTADRAKAYFTVVHGELIQSLDENLQLLERSIIKMMKQFQQIVDQSPSAIIQEPYLRQLTDDMQKMAHETLDIYTQEQALRNKISDIMTLTGYPIHSFTEAVTESKKQIEKVMEALYEFDQAFQAEVRNIENQLTKLQNNIHQRAIERKDVVMTTGASVGFITSFPEGTIGDKIDNGLSSMRHIIAGLNAVDRKMFSFYQIAVLAQLDRKTRKSLFKTGRHSLTLAQYRRLNNFMRFTPYRMSTKEFLYHYKVEKYRGFPKGRLDTFKRIVVPFGKNRGKLAMKQEFDRLYGLQKYQEFKQLKTKPEKFASMYKTFYNKFAGDKIKTTKNIIKNTQWNKPKTFMKSVVNEFNQKTKDLNLLGKSAKVVDTGAKIAGKGLGAFGVALHVRENINQFRGDNQKVIVGSVVDITAGSVSTAVGAAVGSAFLPPLGTIVGAGVGTVLSTGFHAKFGKPPKSLSDHTKNAVNGAIKGVKSGIGKMGKALGKLFK